MMKVFSMSQFVSKFAVMCLFFGSTMAAVPDAAQSSSSNRKSLKKTSSKPAPLVLEELSAGHLAVAEKVVLGTVSCELGAKVHVKPDTSPGRFIVDLGRQSFRMEPTLTTTGAVRLEDPSNGAVWLQLGNKSMLLNTRLGRRLADSCVNTQQGVVASAMEQTKSPGLLDELPPSAVDR
jgi:hypothetical protein